MFVGAAPGDADTVAMLRAALEARRRGIDVVVSGLDASRSHEAAAIARDPGTASGGGRGGDVDVDGIIARRPRLVAVADLGHTNRPGARNHRRFDDVAELREAGIDVWTTVHIDELESCSDVMAQLSGIRVRETVPDRILEAADAVELVDVRPAELLRRLRRADVYVPEHTERALQRYAAASSTAARAHGSAGRHGGEPPANAGPSPDGPPGRQPASARVAAQRPGADPRAAWPSWPGRSGGYVVAAGLVAAAAGVALGVTALLPLRDPGMFFLAAVLLSAVRAGLRPSVFAAVVSVVVYDVLFTRPFYSLRMTDPQDYVSLGAFLAVAILTSHLTARIREQAEAAHRRERRTAALHAFGRATTAAATIDDLHRAIVRHVADAFGGTATLFVPHAGRLRACATHPADVSAPGADVETATSVWQRDAGEAAVSAVPWRYHPLRTARGVVGVLAVDAALIERAPSDDDRELLDAMAGQAALAIEGSRIDVVEAIMDGIDDGIVVLDGARRIVQVNHVACAVLGCERRAVLGRAFDALGAAEPAYVRVRAALREWPSPGDPERPLVEVARRLDGGEHRYVLRCTPFVGRDGAAAGHVLLLQDVTRVREQEARREQLVATLSHELRTPLTSQRMGLELLERALAPLAGRRAELVTAVRTDLARLEDVAQRLLDVSRSRAVAGALERRRVDLDALIPPVVRSFGLQAEEGGVTIETAVVEPGLAIVGDHTALRWALSNLVANALRHTPRGGRVTVAATAGEGVACLAVADTGPGIARGEREHVFDRFVQGRDGTPGSAGLGLAIVRDIVEAHGGRVHLDSEPGQGSRFTLEIPRT